MKSITRSLKGANMDIDLVHNRKVTWKQDKCPWNEKDGTKSHKCAVKNVSICKYFQGVKKPDVVICAFTEK